MQCSYFGGCIFQFYNFLSVLFYVFYFFAETLYFIMCFKYVPECCSYSFSDLSTSFQVFVSAGCLFSFELWLSWHLGWCASFVCIWTSGGLCCESLDPVWSSLSAVSHSVWVWHVGLQWEGVFSLLLYASDTKKGKQSASQPCLTCRHWWCGGSAPCLAHIGWEKGVLPSPAPTASFSLLPADWMEVQLLTWGNPTIPAWGSEHHLLLLGGKWKIRYMLSSASNVGWEIGLGWIQFGKMTKFHGIGVARQGVDPPTQPLWNCRGEGIFPLVLVGWSGVHMLIKVSVLLVHPFPGTSF